MLNFRSIGGTELPKEFLNSITQFQRKRKRGTIDVWWLYDDGGNIIRLLFRILSLVFAILICHYFITDVKEILFLIPDSQSWWRNAILVLVIKIF